MLRANWIHLLILWLKVEEEEAERVAQAWFERTLTLAWCILFAEFIGLLSPWTAFAMFFVNLILGLILVYRAWSPTALLDVGQKFAQKFSSEDGKDKKAEDIPTMKVVGTVFSIVGLLLLLLLVRAYGHFPQGYYLPWILTAIVAILLTGVGAPVASKSLAKTGNLLLLGCTVFLILFVTWGEGRVEASATTTKHGLHLLEFLGTDWTDAQASVMYQIKADARDVQGVFASDMKKGSHAESIAHQVPTSDGKGPQSPAQAFSAAHNTFAQKSYEVQLANLEAQAIAKGLRPKERPDQIVDATLLNPQPMNCLNSELQIKPCFLKPGDIIEITDRINQKRVTANNGDYIDIGPTGYPMARSFSLPYFRDLPRFAVVGEFHRANGTVTSPILIGERYEVREYGTMYLMVNNDYWNCGEGCQYTPRPYPEWVSNNYYVDGRPLPHKFTWHVIRDGSTIQMEEK